MMEGSINVNAKSVPANIITPPSVGMLRVCNFLKSPGVSVRFLRSETRINGGVQMNTTKKEVRNMRKYNPILCYRPLISYCKYSKIDESAISYDL